MILLERITNTLWGRSIRRPKVESKTPFRDWKEIRSFADNCVRVETSTMSDGQEDPIPQRRMTLTLPDRTVVIITSDVIGYPERPETIDVQKGAKRTTFTFNQTGTDRLTSCYSPVYSLFAPDGTRIAGIRGNKFDYALARKYFLDASDLNSDNNLSGTYVSGEIVTAINSI